jgi:SAM-dependent methyltransferase
MGAIGRTVEPNPSSNGHRCRLCSAALKYSFVDLGMSPLCESFLAADQLDSMERYYPLRTQVCEHCFLVQLSEYVSPESIFSEYAYFSSYSTSWVAHAKAYCEMVRDRLDLDENSLVVELASNDGYLLKHFLPLGVPVLGVEPAANVAKVAVGHGIPTRIDFFSAKLAEILVIEGRSADLIVGNNVLAQVPDLNDFTEGMRRLLKPEGVITLEVPHLQRLIEGNQFDTIYHEHFSYFSFTSLEKLAARHDLKLIDVEELSTHGGSLRVYLAHKGSKRQATKAVANMRVREQDLGFCDLVTYAAFQDRVSLTKRKLLDFLIQAKNQGKKICGYGAPGKGNTLLNYCGIGTDFLDFTVDRNPYKHGRFTPGMHIPIYDIDAIDVAQPDFVLILPWNLREEIVRQMRHISNWGGKFVVPIPELEVI